jgi:uncharacterized membrane protein YhaH (DUF805 family)
MKYLFSIFFDFKGIASRGAFSKYIFFYILYILGFRYIPENPEVIKVLYGLFGTLINIGLLAVIFRRSHDFGFSGWWFFLIFIFLIFLSAAASRANLIDINLGFYLFLSFLPLVFFLLLGCIPSKEKNNKYKPNT